ncbi:MAG: septum formation protein Maf [Actinobacteria bacterium]|nr:septum formation protein Maf [Actinomycetota bacterium]
MHTRLPSVVADQQNLHVVLASRSPRRIELIAQLGITADVVPADIDETPLTGEEPAQYVKRLASSKARAVQERLATDALVLGADTTVDLDGVIFGQPVDETEARRMLKALSARTHRVHTGVAVIGPERSESLVVTSMVTFEPVTDALLDWYIGTGEWQGKAGSYAIQGLGGTLVASTRGSMSNIIGLPLQETARLLGLGC